MNEAFFAELSAWLTQAGLAGTPETAIVSGFCDRCVADGLPLARSLFPSLPSHGGSRSGIVLNFLTTSIVISKNRRSPCSVGTS
jgi:hypothetical protein